MRKNELLAMLIGKWTGSQLEKYQKENSRKKTQIVPDRHPGSGWYGEAAEQGHVPRSKQPGRHVRQWQGRAGSRIPGVVRRQRLQIGPLPYDERDAVHDVLLPPHHRDPFDRGLVSQAILRGLTIVTPDPLIARYPDPVLWL